MKVYIILRTTDQEDTNVVGVSASHHGAQAKLAKLLDEDQLYTWADGRVINSGKPLAHEFDIQEWEVEP